ncbi:uncharacterized protein [Montipora foliosa]|uniref:uncharacterized protein n=1 Tax=Montipora foliosa TaxID=591990 RepID=UPI0035F12FE6
MSLTLSVASGATKDFKESEKDLKSIETFTRAVVKDGTWIFYKYKDFNDKTDNKESWIKFLTPSEHEVDISDVNGSFYLLPDHSQGLVLFEHYYYGGTRKYYNSDCDNLNQDFPSGKAEGVSGAIVLGGKFDVFTKPNGGGVSSILTEGRYPTAPTMSIGNDRIQSIRKLK